MAEKLARENYKAKNEVCDVAFGFEKIEKKFLTLRFFVFYTITEA